MSNKALGVLMAEHKGKIIFSVRGAPNYISQYTTSKNSVLLEWYDDNGDYNSEELYKDEELPSHVTACVITEL